MECSYVKLNGDFWKKSNKFELNSFQNSLTYEGSVLLGGIFCCFPSWTYVLRFLVELPYMGFIWYALWYAGCTCTAYNHDGSAFNF